MVTVTTITRSESERIRKAKGWVLIHGRRKVGKTFLVRNFIEHDLYVLVKRGGGAILDGGPLNRTDDHSQVMDIVINSLKDGMTVVVDEFQRLPDELIERLQMVHPKGRLILLGSSMHVARDLISKRSPLLGLLSEVKLSLISPCDILDGLSRAMPAEDALALSPYLRDPWALRFLDGAPENVIAAVLEYSRSAIPALIGEVFLDEDRSLSEVYEGILRSIASGKSTQKEIADQLHSRRLIDKNDPSRVRPFIKIMEDMDLIQRVALFGERGNHYSVRSKLVELHYYLDEKHDLEGTKPTIIKEVFRDLLPFHVQTFVGELMAEILDGTFQYHMTGDCDIDVIVTRRERPIFVGEVKWKRRVTGDDISRFLKNTEGFDCRKALISRVPLENTKVEVITPQGLVDMARACREKRA